MRRVARQTGFAYLALALAGFVGFVLIRQHLSASGELARIGIAADLVTVLAQACAAVGFYRLFHRVNAVAAAATAAFGLANAVVVLIATAFSAAAPGSADPHLLLELNAKTWELGGIFFGLWLLPMGWLTRRSGFLPVALGWTLTVGGLAYLVTTFFPYAVTPAPAVTTTLPLIATVGELWMIAALLTGRFATGATSGTTDSE